MPGFYFAINGEPKDLRQSESGSYPYACADQRQVVHGARKFLSGRTEFDDSASVREGGSIGAVVTMADKLKVPVLFMGMSLPEDGYHGPDESFAWRQIEGGVRAFVKYFELIGKK